MYDISDKIDRIKSYADNWYEQYMTVKTMTYNHDLTLDEKVIVKSNIHIM